MGKVREVEGSMPLLLKDIVMDKNDIGREEFLFFSRRLKSASLKRQTDSWGLEMVRHVQLVLAKDLNLVNNEYTLEESQVAENKREMLRNVLAKDTTDIDIDMDIDIDIDMDIDINMDIDMETDNNVYTLEERDVDDNEEGMI